MNVTLATSLLADPARRFYFVAIGGIGMSAIARVLLARGVKVAGSDANDSALLRRLRELGAQAHLGHDAGHLKRNDVVVLSDAIKPGNPEWRRAQECQLPVIKRADLLGALANAGRGIAVSGTHGKTSTSGMLAMILLEGGMDPTCILGGELAPLGGNARPGGDLTLVEACEAYNSFLDLTPEAAIVMNIEIDHLDFHGTPEHLFDSFRQFLRQARGFAVLNTDDPLLATMTGIPPRAVTYGKNEQARYRCADIALGAEPSFTLLRDGREVGRVTLRVPGAHNVSNATGAAALALELGADFCAVQRGLAAFPGMHRRFERMGNCGLAAVVDDYAHHPTEIRATLRAAREAFPGRIVAVFQPHLFSRTRDLLNDFAAAFADADAVFIAPIYPAREAPIPGVSHTQLVDRMREVSPAPPVFALESLDEAVRILRHAAAGSEKYDQAAPIPKLKNGDVIITMGAGNVDAIAHELVKE